jgi:hypothetical protein
LFVTSVFVNFILIVEVGGNLLRCKTGKLAKLIDANKLVRLFGELLFYFTQQLPAISVAFAGYPLNILWVNNEPFCFYRVITML